MRARKWTDEKLVVEALKYKSRYAFEKGSNGAYQAALKRESKFMDFLFSHVVFARHKKYSDEDLAIIAKKYITKGEFQKKCGGAYNSAKLRGGTFFNKICSHMPEHVDQSRENASNFKWTENRLREEALKYDTRGEFQKNSPNAHRAACKKGPEFLIFVCAHMPPPLRQPWTEEELKTEALFYKRRIDFRNGSTGAYQAAYYKGLEFLDMVCLHMDAISGSSSQELDLLDIIREVFPEAKKHRILKLDIPGKPFIHRFETDIFIPSLMKGIEFDGTYYHSFKYMRGDYGKRFWSDDDIKNYSNIKDLAFLSRDISILHIRQEEWVYDREVCIQRCLEFLGVSNEQ